MRVMAQDMREMDVALSGSSTKFLAHIGFLKALRHHGIKIVRAGTNSGGTLTMAMYLIGNSLEEMERIAMDTDYTKFVPTGWKAILRLITKGYLSPGHKYLKLLEELFGNKRMGEIETPFYIMTSDITNGRLEIISQETHPDMSVALAVYMSSCMPMAFRPIVLDGVSYRDGGLYKDFPIDIWPDTPRWRIGHLIGKVKKIQHKDWWSGRDEAFMLADRAVDANVDSSMQHIPDLARTIIIESNGYDLSSLTFDIDRELKLALQEQGYSNTIAKLHPYSEPFEETI